MKRRNQQRLSREEVRLDKEAGYIKRAQSYESRVVGLGSVAFFSTQTGDAWLLDPADGLALCLTRGGGRHDFNILETPLISKYRYRIDEENLR
jgi:hypothetical protein